MGVATQMEYRRVARQPLETNACDAVNYMLSSRPLSAFWFGRSVPRPNNGRG